MIPELTKLEKFYEEMIEDPNHRSKSFEHCYTYFQHIKDKDKAMLHIAFYLSSWGMYRGSSFLLQKDYKIYDKIIDILKKSEYKQLTNLEDIKEKDIEKYLELIYDLYSNLEKELNQIRINYYNSINKTVKNNISPTLITKIMLGTIGCIPAYDRFFQLGIKRYNDNSNNKLIQNFSKNSIRQILLFLIDNKKELINIQSKIKIKTKFKYPLMKLIDSYFWEVGIEK